MNKTYYQNELNLFSFDLSPLEGKSLMVSGATGMIGSYLIDCILHSRVNCRILALGRSEEKAHSRFAEIWEDPRFVFYTTDLNVPLTLAEPADYILHAASNTHPKAYATDPIGTVTANVIGLKNLLDYACTHGTQRFLFLSSVEIYGENRGDTEAFDEAYCGYIDCNTLRAGYPESKRVGETLCQAYIRQKGLDIVIPRLCRVFGPTLLDSDTKALSQFLHKAAAGEDIVLKSAGTQYFSYAYVADVVTGILTCLFHGKNGEAYNIANEACNITLRDLAQCIAQTAGTKVVFDLPDSTERAGYSTATKAILNCDKLKALGWQPTCDLAWGIARTLPLISTGGSFEKS